MGRTPTGSPMTAKNQCFQVTTQSHWILEDLFEGSKGYIIDNSHWVDEAIAVSTGDCLLPRMLSAFPFGFSVSPLVRVCIPQVTLPLLAGHSPWDGMLDCDNCEDLWGCLLLQHNPTSPD